MDKFVKRYSSAIEATPTKWLTEPLPSAPTKNPVGHPRKRPLDDDQEQNLLLSLIYKTIGHTHFAVHFVRVKMKMIFFRLTGVYEYLLCKNTNTVITVL